ETIEDVFNNGVYLRTRVAGGKQLLTGVFVQDVYTPLPVLELVGGVRVDYWSNYNGNRKDTPPSAGVPARQTFGDSERFLTSPRGAALPRDVHHRFARVHLPGLPRADAQRAVPAPPRAERRHRG